MKQKLKENFQLIITFAAVIGIVVSGLAYFAKASDLQQVEYRLDQKIKADKAYYLKRQLWALYDKHKTQDCNRMPQPDCSICRDLKHELVLITGGRG